MRNYRERLPSNGLKFAQEVTRLFPTYSLPTADHSGRLVPWCDPELCVGEIERCIETYKLLDHSSIVIL
jgi:hypothetical protein